MPYRSYEICYFIPFKSTCIFWKSTLKRFVFNVSIRDVSHFLLESWCHAYSYFRVVVVWQLSYWFIPLRSLFSVARWKLDSASDYRRWSSFFSTTLQVSLMTRSNIRAQLIKQAEVALKSKRSHLPSSFISFQHWWSASITICELGRVEGATEVCDSSFGIVTRVNEVLEESIRVDIEDNWWLHTFLVNHPGPALDLIDAYPREPCTIYLCRQIATLVQVCKL